MKAAIASLALVGAAALAWTPAPAQTGSNDDRVRRVIVYGSDPCPRGTGEIVICGRRPDRDRYRIPENLRSDPNDPTNQAWATRARELQYVGRSGIGSCSPVGPGGSIGCFSDIVRAARAERDSPDAVNWHLLIEEARKERLSKIDADAREIEGEPPLPPK